MRSPRTLLIAFLVMLAIALTACSKSGTDKIKDGAAKMQTELATLKVSVDKGDAAAAQKQFNTLHDAWAAFEDDVRAKDKSMYEKIEDPLTVLNGGTKQSSLDKTALLSEITKLDGLLNGLVK